MRLSRVEADALMDAFDAADVDCAVRKRKNPRNPDDDAPYSVSVSSFPSVHDFINALTVAGVRDASYSAGSGWDFTFDESLSRGPGARSGADEHTVRIDAAEYEEALDDPKVKETLRAADAVYEEWEVRPVHEGKDAGADRCPPYTDPNPTRIGEAKYGCPRDSGWCDGVICREKGIECPNADSFHSGRGDK